jgi:hypothetical protein
MTSEEIRLECLRLAADTAEPAMEQNLLRGESVLWWFRAYEKAVFGIRAKSRRGSTHEGG